MKKLEGAHHRCLKKLLGISWKDKVTNATKNRIDQLAGKYAETKASVVARTRTSHGSDLFARQTLNWQPVGGYTGSVDDQA